MTNNFIQKSIKHPGRVHEYLASLYGDEAFTERGTIKMEYLNSAEKIAQANHNRSLVDALNEAKTLKHLAERKMYA